LDLVQLKESMNTQDVKTELLQSLKAQIDKLTQERDGLLVKIQQITLRNKHLSEDNLRKDEDINRKNQDILRMAQL
jgi:hypothetical protein